MTITTTTPRAQYNGNGATTAFSVPFEFLEAEGVKVIFTDADGVDATWVKDTHYTLTNNAAAATGTVNVKTTPTDYTPASGTKITILRNQPLKQTTSYSNNDPFPAKSHEKALDRLDMQIQMLKEKLDRAALLKETSTEAGLIFPEPEADKFIAWNAAGDDLENKTAADLGAVVVSNDVTLADDSQTDVTTEHAVKTYADTKLAKASNLSDLTDTGAARGNLDVPAYVATRSALKALDITEDAAAFLAESGREGLFRFIASDLSTEVAADTAEGIYIAPASDSDGSSGAWVRVFDGPWWASWFGVMPSATAANNVTAINAMLVLAVLGDTKINIEAGVHEFNAKITVSTGFSLSLRGSEAEGTTLQWTNASGGLDLTYTDLLQPPMLHDISFKTTAAAGGTALKITSPVSASMTRNGPVLEDISISGFDTAADYWTNGIHLVNCWYPSIIRPSIKGKDEAALPFSMTAGIIAEACQVVRLRDCALFHMTRAYQTTGATLGEGLSVSGGEIVGVAYGIDHTRASATSGSHIHDIHINAYFRCIVLNNIAQMDVHDNLLYKTHLSTEDWQGVELATCLNCHVHGNEIATPGVSGGTHFGITLAGTTDCKIHDNKFSYYSSGSGGILVATSAGNNEIYNNSKPFGDTYPTNVVQISGALATNRLWGNQPVPTQTFTSLDTTPSVGNDQSGLWTTANAGSTSITTFDDGYEGQVIEVQVNDTQTTFVHSASLILRNSLSTLAPNGAIFKFRKNGSLWREISRNYDRLQGTATYDPASLADGAGATTTVTVTGAALGDIALASFSLDTSGITITAWVSAANTVSVRFQNESGGVLDIGSGTLKAWVLK